MSSENNLFQLQKEPLKKPGTFIIEFAGTPLWQRFDKLIDPIGDIFTQGFGFDILYKGTKPNYIMTTYGPERTSEEILNRVARTINTVKQDRFNSHNVFLNSSVFEELAYLNYFNLTDQLSDEKFQSATSQLLSCVGYIDFIILVLFSELTANEANAPRKALERLCPGVNTGTGRIDINSLNQSFLATLEKYGKSFYKVSVIDLQSIERKYLSEEIGSPLGKHLGKALSRVYPIPPNIFAYKHFPRGYCTPQPPLIKKMPKE